MIPKALTSPEYSFKSAPDVGHHVTQVAIDQQGEYAVATSGSPLDAAQKLREIAAHIEEMETQDAAE